MIAAALCYAAKGWRVLPIKPNGKAPLNSNGVTGATVDENTIREWWKKWPTANVGIATGNGLTVLDIDPRNGGSVDGLDIPDTPSVKTGGGGMHYYFAGDAPNSASKLGPGIDVQGAGKYVVGPPSVHPSGEPYSWLDEDEPLAQAPEWLHSKVATPPAISPQAATSEEKIPLGRQESAMMSVLGAARRHGAGEESLFALASAENDARFEPKIRARDIDRMVHSTIKYPPEREAIAERKPSGNILAELDPGSHKLSDQAAFTAERFPTGIPAIDKATGGGLALGRLVVLVGPPGAGKTTWGVQLAFEQVISGRARMVGLFNDEGKEPAFVRMGQILGFDNKELTGGGLQRARLAEEIAAAPVRILEDATLYDLARVASMDGLTTRIERQRSLPLIIVVDSIQKCRLGGGEDSDNIRQAIKGRSEFLKEMARKLPALVIATSQANRSAYRDPAGSKGAPSTLTAASESSEIEYAADVDLVLMPVSKDSPFVYVDMPKNRIPPWEKPAFYLTLNHATARYSQADPESIEAEREAEGAAKEAAAANAEKLRVLKFIKVNPGEATVTVAAGSKVRKATAALILKALVKQGAIYGSLDEGSSHAKLWFPVRPDDE